MANINLLRSRPTALCFLSLPLLLLLAVFFFQTTLSQAPSASSSDPLVAACQPLLLSLIPCAPFVQGTVLSPSGSCCDSLDRIYGQQPSCICLLLSSSNFDSIPINSTLAVQLPQLCHLQLDASVCSGLPAPATVPAQTAPSSPASQVSFGAKNDPSVAASPKTPLAPGPSIVRSGSSQNKARMLAAGRSTACLGVFVITLLIVCLHILDSGFRS